MYSTKIILVKVQILNSDWLFYRIVSSMKANRALMTRPSASFK